MPPVSRSSAGWLRAARAAWLAYCLAALCLFAFGLTVRYHEVIDLDTYRFGDSLRQLGLSLEFFAVYTTVLNTLTAAAFTGISLIVFFRRKDDWVALATSLTCFNVIIGLIPWIPQSDAHGAAWYSAAIFLRAFGFSTAIFFFYIFPDGRFYPAWARPLAVALAVYALSWGFLPEAMPPMDFAALNVLHRAPALGVAVAFLASGVLAQVLRYRTNPDPLKRQQTRWVLFGSLAVFASFALVTLPMLVYPELRKPGMLNTGYLITIIPILIASLIMLPVSMAVSILRFRLWDIDLIIRRTLVYSLLSAVSILLYLGSVILLQRASRLAFGAETSLTVVISTLAIAALFNPLRRRIQLFIDRRFYRQKYDAQRALDEFSSAARSEVSLENLTARLVSVVDETVSPEATWIWIRETTRKSRP